MFNLEKIELLFNIEVMRHMTQKVLTKLTVVFGRTMILQYHLRNKQRRKV